MAGENRTCFCTRSDHDCSKCRTETPETVVYSGPNFPVPQIISPKSLRLHPEQWTVEELLSMSTRELAALLLDIAKENKRNIEILDSLQRNEEDVS